MVNVYQSHYPQLYISERTMFLRRIIIAVLMLLVLLPLSVTAAEREQAKQLAEKAAAYIEANGIEVARKAMHDKNSEFIDGELYVFVQSFDGVMLIHGTNAKLEGKNLSNLKDLNGVYFPKEMIKLGKNPGSGWVEYMWKHPTTKKLTPKVSYVTKIKNMDAVAGVGIFE